MNKNKIVAIGDLVNGFKFFGPMSRSEANEWLEDYMGPYEIYDLISPTEDVETELVLDNDSE
jgi:hypothetical protein